MNEIFWNNVKALLKSNKLKQSDLAEKLGVGVRIVQDWVYLKRIPDMEKVKQIADMFNVTVDSLITESEDTENDAEIGNLVNMYCKLPDFAKTAVKTLIKQLSDNL